MTRVCMLSSLHGLYDDRIYWKEALSLAQNGYEVLHVGIETQERDFISEHGIRLISISRKRYFKNNYIDKFFRFITFRPDVYKKMLQVCAALSCDVYHFHDVQVNRIAPRIKALPNNPKVIYDVHEDYRAAFISNVKETGVANLLARIYAYFLRRWELSRARHYDFIIPAYEAIRKIFLEVVPAGKMEIILNYTTLSPEISENIFPAKPFDAIYCGLINRNRGAMQILEAVVLVRERLPGIRVLFLGPLEDERLKQEMTGFIREKGIQDNILLREPVPYTEIDRYYRDSKIGLGIFMPVPVFYTAIQIKTFEYMVYGLPIVCSNFGNISRYVQENDCGITVNPLIPHEIADALHTLLTDHELYTRTSRNGRKAVLEKYHWKLEEKKLLAIYKNLTA